jgi:hypothetical protein
MAADTVFAVRPTSSQRCDAVAWHFMKAKENTERLAVAEGHLAFAMTNALLRNALYFCCCSWVPTSLQWDFIPFESIPLVRPHSSQTVHLNCCFPVNVSLCTPGPPPPPPPPPPGCCSRADCYCGPICQWQGGGRAGGCRRKK